uniref:EF-hand domain-containing protein n=1 Tax=Angiostrongylus cantonensis TaxID=6313 RepID=A0A0K0D0G1_ANGCA
LKISELVSPSAFLKRGLEPSSELLESAKRVLNALSDDENGFNLQEVVKAKRPKQEIRQENISEWLAELETAEEESKVKHPQIRFVDRARARLSDNFDFHMASLLDEVSVLTGAEDEESDLLYGIALARLLSLRSLAIEFGRHAEFNEWLLSSKNRPEWARFCSSIAFAMSVSVAPSLDTVVDEIKVPSSSLSEESNTVCLKQIMQEGIENSSKCLSPTFERNPMGICEKVYEAAKQRAIDKEYVQSITEQEILAFSYQLQRETNGTTEESLVAMEKIYQFLSQSPQAVRECFSSAVINKLVMHSNNQDGCISSHVLIDFLHTCCRRLRQRLLLQSVAKSIEYITSNEFIDFLMTEISNKIMWEEGMKDYPFYYAVFVERCVFFHLDPQKTGKVLIQDLTFTVLLDDLFEILVDQKQCDEEYQGNAATSWCSLNNFWRVLQQFRHCDKSWSGMVSLEECRSIRDGALSPLFLERVFATQTLYGERSCQEMDFRGFVELDIAFRTRNAESMLTNLLLLEGGSDCIADDIVDEIFDMVNPKIQDRISLKDMLDSRMAETALGILIDYPSFLKYEKKEEETGS